MYAYYEDFCCGGGGRGLQVFKIFSVSNFSVVVGYSNIIMIYYRIHSISQKFAAPCFVKIEQAMLYVFILLYGTEEKKKFMHHSPIFTAHISSHSNHVYLFSDNTDKYTLKSRFTL